MRLTPLNIASASIVVWFLLEDRSADNKLFSWLSFIGLIVLLLLIDLLFRLLIKENKRMWLLQIGFLVVVCLISLIIKVAVV